MQSLRPMCIILIYRPAFLSQAKFYDNLDDLLVKISSKFKTYGIFLVGDLNINDVSTDNCNISDLLSSNNLCLIIYYPTRVCQNSATLIENIFTNTNSKWLSGVIDSTLSNHYLLFNCAYA